MAAVTARTRCGLVEFRECVGGCLHELYKVSNIVWK